MVGDSIRFNLACHDNQRSDAITFKANKREEKERKIMERGEEGGGIRCGSLGLGYDCMFR